MINFLSQKIKSVLIILVTQKQGTPVTIATATLQTPEMSHEYLLFVQL